MKRFILVALVIGLSFAMSYNDDARTTFALEDKEKETAELLKSKRNVGMPPDVAEIIEQQARIVRSKRVVIIESRDLENILSSGKTFNFQKEKYMESFLTEFKQFLIQFNWREDDDDKVLELAAEHNIDYYANNPQDSIHLWVSFQPRYDIMEDLEEVADAISKTNLIYPGTVSTIVLDYGLLQLDRQSLLLVNHEIGKASQKIKSLHGANIKFGLQLEIMNCQNRIEYMKGLQLNLVDVVVLISEDRSISVQSERDLLSVVLLNLPCMKLPQFESLLTVDTRIEIDVAFDNNSYDISRFILEEMIEEDGEIEFFREAYIKAVLFSAFIDNQRKNYTVEEKSRYYNTNMTELQLINWLQQATKFNKLHFGAVITSKEQTATLIVPDSFRSIVIDCCKHNDRYELEKLKRMLGGLVNYSSSMKTSSNDGYKIRPEQELPLQIKLLVGITEIDFKSNKKQVDIAISALEYVNKLAPGTVNGVMIDWVPNGHSNQKSGGYCSYLLRYKELSELISYTGTALEKSMSTENVSVEIVLDAQVVSEFFRNPKTGCDRYFGDFLSEMRDVKHRTCKVVIADEDIRLNGAVKILSRIISDLNHCEQILSLNERTSIIAHRVQIVGCNGCYSSSTKLTEFVRLYESLSIWATVNDKRLYVDAGVESSVECQKKRRLSPSHECKCGWWVAVSSTLDSTQSEVEILDKKSLALQLFENKWNSGVSPETCSEKSGVDKEMLVYILVPLLVLVIFVISLASFLVFHYQSKYIMTKQEVAIFLRGQLQNNNSEGVAHSQPYQSSEYELAPSAFKIDRTTCLGAGEFGKIFRGSINRDGVEVAAAVKVANVRTMGKSQSGRLALNALLSEIKVLSYVGKHDHIVSLLGAYTANLRRGDVAIFLELCEVGSLYKYLRSINPHEAVQVINEDDYGIPLMDISHQKNLDAECYGLDIDIYNELYGYAGQIACGMEFISQRNVVHADLASRNVLLTRDKVAKISDFGLSRRLYDYTEYVKQNQAAPLPWRWMAPEALRRLIFNEKTDVWAFGVTLWEIFTLGDEPYPGLSWDVNFPSMLSRGLQLHAPRYNIKEIYSVMRRCWEIDPALRPTFSELKLELNGM